MLRTVNHFRQTFRIGIRFIEQSRHELGTQYASDSSIDLLLLHLTGLHKIGQTGVSIGTRGLKIHTGIDAHDCRLRRIGCHMMEVVQLAQASVIGEYISAEAPLSAQYVGEQPAIAVGRHAVHLIVRRHHGTHIGFLHNFFERIQMESAHLALTQRRRSEIYSACRYTVACEMFCRTHQLAGSYAVGACVLSLALHTLDKRHTHACHDVRILAETFLRASITRFAGQIEQRRQRLIHSRCRSLKRYDRSHTLHKCRVPRASLRYGLRKNGGAHCQLSVQTLAYLDGRYAQTCILTCITLGLRRHASNLLYTDERTLNDACPVRQLTVFAHAVHIHLRYFLLKSHTTEKVFHTLINTCIGIFVCLCVRRNGNRQAHGYVYRKSSEIHFTLLCQDKLHRKDTKNGMQKGRINPFFAFTRSRYAQKSCQLAA